MMQGNAHPIMPRTSTGLAREGYPFIILSFFLMILGYWFYWPVGIVFAVLFLFCVYFFRDPERKLPADTNLLISPADGKVLKVESLSDQPYYSQAHQKISIFMSGVDVHVNRIPCDGQIKEVHYYPGKFFVASLDKASVHNERNAVVLETPTRERVVFSQIAGLVARRIVCYLKEGLEVCRGQRYGLIRFGSRMEVSIPQDWEILVKPGQKVQAGTTALAKLSLIETK